MPDHVHLFVRGGQRFDLGMWVRGLKRTIANALPDVVAPVPDAQREPVSGARLEPVPGAQPSPNDAKAQPRDTTETGRAPGTGATTSAIWQPGFFDHVMRDSESYASKWQYVRDNPLRAGLVERSEDWPYQGEIVLIDRV
jgi:REP element-mobilizing transposase RayT